MRSIEDIAREAGASVLLCRRDCRCALCVRTALHIVKRVRSNDAAKQTRSLRAARALDSTAALAAALRA